MQRRKGVSPAASGAAYHGRAELGTILQPMASRSEIEGACNHNLTFEVYAESHAENSTYLVGTLYTVKPKDMLQLRLLDHPDTRVFGAWHFSRGAVGGRDLSINRVAECRLTHGDRSHDTSRAIRQKILDILKDVVGCRVKKWRASQGLFSLRHVVTLIIRSEITYLFYFIRSQNRRFLRIYKDAFFSLMNP